MRKIGLVFSLVLFYLFSLQVNAQWFPQISGTTADLSSVVFTDSVRGFTVGNYGTILKTTDGGINWVNKNSGTTFHLSAVQFINPNVGWIVGRWENQTSIVLKTNDGGENWEILFQGFNGVRFMSISFIDSSIGWAVSDSYVGATFKTHDGGRNWMQQDSLPHNGGASGLEDVYAFNQNIVYTVGGFTPNIFTHPPPTGIVRYSNNGGITWTSDWPNYSAIIFHAIEFLDQNTRWLVSDNGYIIKTSNGGSSWIVQLNQANSIRNIKFTDQNNGWAVGSTGTIYFTTNGGTNWNSQASGTYNGLYSIYFINQHKGWVVGQAGIILHTSNGGISTVEVDINSPTKFSLEQNYPNPFNPSTKISWQSPVGSWQTLKIYDILGNEVVTLVNEYKNAGSYETEFNASQLASGIYYYQLRAGDYVETKKLILLK